MPFYLNEEQLKSLGFTKLAPNQFITSPYQKAPKEQWVYNNVILRTDEEEGKLYYRFFDKTTPEFSFGFQNHRQLNHILRLIDEGKTISDIWLLEQELRRKEVERMLELQKNKPYLEDYRYNDIGGSLFEIGFAPGQKVYMTYEKHATSAYYYTLNDIANLEHAKDTVHTGSQSHSAISFWFLAFESYINSLVKLCCIKKSEPFDKYKREDLHTRVGSLARLLELDMKSFYTNNIIAKVNEFACFRNDLFHDRHFGEELKFTHTAFSPIPIFSCQVDIMQSILILLETASMLRFAVTGLDTMPSVILKNEDVAIWEKLDVAYEKILQPWFEAVLDKHKMQTRLNFIFKKPLQFTSTVFQKGDISCSVTVDQRPEYEYWLNGEATNIGSTLHNQHLKSYNLMPGAMLLNKVVL